MQIKLSKLILVYLISILYHNNNNQVLTLNPKILGLVMDPQQTN